METLREVYERTKLGTKYGDKGSVHSYIEKYEELIQPFRNDCSLLELGVGYGESLIMWEDYIEKGLVIGVQHLINEKLRAIIDKYQLNVINMSATAPDLSNVLSIYNFDIIIDDASHKIGDQITSFKNINSLLKPNGLYIIEDIQDIDSDRGKLEQLGPCEIFDFRERSGRNDDVMVVYGTK